MKVLKFLFVLSICACTKELELPMIDDTENLEEEIENDIKLIFPLSDTIYKKVINFEWSSEMERFFFQLYEDEGNLSKVFDTILYENNVELKLPLKEEQNYLWSVRTNPEDMKSSSFKTDYLNRFLGAQDMIIDRDCFTLFNNTHCDSVWQSSITFTKTDHGIHALDSDSIVYFELLRDTENENENSLLYTACNYFKESTTAFEFNLEINSITGGQDVPCGAGQTLNYKFYQ